MKTDFFASSAYKEGLSSQTTSGSILTKKTLVSPVLKFCICVCDDW